MQASSSPFLEGFSQESFDSSDSGEELDTSPHEDRCASGFQGVQKVWRDRYKVRLDLSGPGRDLIHLFPSKGDKPPLESLGTTLGGSSHLVDPNPEVSFQEAWS